MKKFFVLILLLVIAGCNSQPADTSNSGSDSDSNSTADDSNRRLQIAVIPKGTAHEFWKSVHAGAEKAAEERGVDIIWKGPQIENDTAGQIQTVRNFITKKVDGICLAPNHSEALQEVVEEAKLSDIPVVIFDSGLAEGAEFLSYVATDNFHGGELAAQQLAKAIGEKGSVIMMRYRAGSESTEQREEGFLSAIKEFPDIEVVSSDQYGEATTAMALEKAQTLLLKYGDEIQGTFAVCEPNCNGMLEALENSGHAGKVKFVAFDPSEKLVTGLREDKVHGIVLQDPVSMGYKSVMTMVDHLEGKDVEKVVSTGEFVATPENIDGDESQRLLHPVTVE